MSKFVGNESKSRLWYLFWYSHTIDICPTFKVEIINALGCFYGQPQWEYNPFSRSLQWGLEISS